MAAANGFNVIVETLLSSGASVALRGGYGDQPLHSAARCGSWKCAEELIKWNADINQTNDEQYTPLHLAAQAGHEEFLTKLLHKEVQHEVQTKEGYSPLFLAAVNGHTNCVKVLQCTTFYFYFFLYAFIYFNRYY